jgi:hypothetical protein
VRKEIVLPALALVAACASEPDEYDGIGRWKVTKTTLSQADGRCLPTDLPDGRKGSYCVGQTPVKIAGSVAEIDLYFDGTEPTSRLIEEQLKVRGCREEEVLTVLRKLFGTSIGTKGPKVFWKNRFAFVAAIAPSDPGQCLIRIFPLSEAAEIQKVQE